jgi:hypothetical protein
VQPGRRLVAAAAEAPLGLQQGRLQRPGPGVSPLQSGAQAGQGLSGELGVLGQPQALLQGVGPAVGAAGRFLLDGGWRAGKVRAGAGMQGVSGSSGRPRQPTEGLTGAAEAWAAPWTG